MCECSPCTLPMCTGDISYGMMHYAISKYRSTHRDGSTRTQRSLLSLTLLTLSSLCLLHRFMEVWGRWEVVVSGDQLPPRESAFGTLSLFSLLSLALFSTLFFSLFSSLSSFSLSLSQFITHISHSDCEPPVVHRLGECVRHSRTQGSPRLLHCLCKEVHSVHTR